MALALWSRVLGSGFRVAGFSASAAGSVAIETDVLRVKSYM